MFVTAGVDLKFHENGKTSLFTYKPLSFGNITSVSWSGDNGFITIVGENGAPEIISVKDASNVKTVHVITAVRDVSVATFERTTKRFIGLGTFSGQSVLYDTKSKAIHQQFPDVPGAINLLDFNYGDRQMAVSSYGGNLFIFDVANLNGRKMYATPSTVSALRFHPNDRRSLMCGAENGSVMLWDVEAGKNVHCNQLHTAAISGLALANGADLTLISVGYDNKFCIYDTNSGTCTFRSNQRHPLTSVDAHLEDNTFAIGSLFGNLYIYDVRNLIAPLACEIPHNSKINKISYENDKTKDVLKGVPESSISLQPEIKFMNRNLDANANNSDTNVYCGNVAEDESNRIDAFAAVVVESQKSPTASLKREVADAVRTCAEELQAQIAKQMENLQEFILNEFKTICNGIESKWDFQNFGDAICEEVREHKSQ